MASRDTPQAAARDPIDIAPSFIDPMLQDKPWSKVQGQGVLRGNRGKREVADSPPRPAPPNLGHERWGSPWLRHRPPPGTLRGRAAGPSARALVRGHLGELHGSGRPPPLRARAGPARLSRGPARSLPLPGLERAAEPRA